MGQLPRGEGRSVRPIGRALILALALIVGCGASAPPSAAAPRARTCLVLSVGEHRGLAHAGAIRAVREAGIQIDCVVGTSMGAFVGLLYAAFPDVSPEASLRDFSQRYLAASTEDASAGSTLSRIGCLFGSFGCMAAGALGLGDVRPVDHARFVRVLGEMIGEVMIESLPVAFGTVYLGIDDVGVRWERTRHGDAATAVGRSVANPFVFAEIDVREVHIGDPGVDRLARVPIEDACAMFPDAQLLAISVAGPAMYTRAVHCPVRVIEIAVPEVDPAEAFALGPAFDALVDAGYQQTRQALGRAVSSRP